MGNTPNIRFKGFTDDWEQRKLGEVSDVRDGTHDSPKYQSIGHPFVTSKNVKNGYITYDDIQYISDEDFAEINKRSKVDINDILMGMIGTIGNMALIRTEPDFAIKNVALIKDTKQINYLYLYHLLQSPFIEKQLTSGMDGGTQKFVSLGNVRNLNVIYPSDIEQDKIGCYFEKLDHLITLHQRKCDETKKLKKFMLQKMFPKKDAKKPEIRFAGFTDDWEQRKLGEICQRVIRKNKNNESDLPLTIASQYGLIDQRDFFNKVVAAKDMSNYYLLRKGEFAYNKSYSNGFEYGSIKRLNAYEQGCLSTLYICFEITSDEVDSDYLECFFDTLKWYGDLSMICAEGARNHGLLNVDIKAFFADINVSTPTNLKEQRKIATYLNNLDHLITLHQRKCDKLKKFKKYMLQNMFPQKG
ncbi:restriction endonuclease subunit S [Lachnospira eligens]|uniref:Restriction endonuclease subunit S n=1 Tax=Lachnospira eligens TaxID=39485 RepID=A0A413YV55_9FIRM|nr:restriction endonuclease subunit S [Lachnospira eligens]RHC12918.1 restriction endonuclease subunit S [Lachnospira eligens]